MASRLDVPYRTYQGYETGASEPKAKVLERLVELGFSGNWLLTGTGPMRTDATATAPICGSGGFPAQVILDAELNARVVEAVSAAYADLGAKIGPRDLGRVAAEIYNDIAAAGLESWEEKMGALRLAAGQLRRRLAAPPADTPGPATDKRLA